MVRFSPRHRSYFLLVSLIYFEFLVADHQAAAFCFPLCGWGRMILRRLFGNSSFRLEKRTVNIDVPTVHIRTRQALY